MDQPTTEIRKYKVGTWHPRTFYEFVFNGKAYGGYKTKAEAKAALEAHIKADLEYWKELGEEFRDL